MPLALVVLDRYDLISAAGRVAESYVDRDGFRAAELYVGCGTSRERVKTSLW